MDLVALLCYFVIFIVVVGFIVYIFNSSRFKGVLYCFMYSKRNLEPWYYYCYVFYFYICDKAQ